MTEPTKATGAEAADPSMEDILASIRRILNEDEAGATPELETTAPQAAAAEAEDDDVLVLDRTMLVSAPEDDPQPEPEPVAVTEAPAALAPPREPEPRPQAVELPVPVMPPVMAPFPVGEPSLLAPEAAAAAASSVDGLLRTLAASRSTQVYRGGPTIEDLVREEIRPLLKDWLDNHLPGLVERLVRTEIERVVGRAVS
ncbi:MAG: DUF2497 domain-containing protein [Rhodopila sp.]